MMPVRRTQSWLPGIFNDFFDNDWMERANATAPAINVLETENNYKVELAAPGMTKEDFNVHIDEDSNLVITMSRLQNHITAYRTSKARKDLAFAQKLYREAKASYTTAQKKYATFADANQNLILFSYRSEQERLQNEMTLAYNVYSQTAQQLQMAKAKVQEITPVYTVVQPATVPLKPAKPNKMMILIGFVFLAGVGSVGWILFIKDLLKNFKKA